MTKMIACTDLYSQDLLLTLNPAMPYNAIDYLEQNVRGEILIQPLLLGRGFW